MNIIRCRPLNLINNIREGINKLLKNWEIFPSNKQFFPRADIKEEIDKFIVRAEIPGLDPKDIQVFLTPSNHLVIKGNTEIEKRTEEEKFLRIERFGGSFYREFPLTSNVKEGEIQANARRGILEIIIPKVEVNKIGKLIEIKSGEE